MACDGIRFLGVFQWSLICLFIWRVKCNLFQCKRHSSHCPTTCWHQSPSHLFQSSGDVSSITSRSSFQYDIFSIWQHFSLGLTMSIVLLAMTSGCLHLEIELLLCILADAGSAFVDFKSITICRRKVLFEASSAPSTCHWVPRSASH